MMNRTMEWWRTQLRGDYQGRNLGIGPKQCHRSAPIPDNARDSPLASLRERPLHGAVDHMVGALLVQRELHAVGFRS